MKAAAHGKIRRKKAFKYKCPFIISSSNVEMLEILQFQHSPANIFFSKVLLQ
jgi:hypothetical protein